MLRDNRRIRISLSNRVRRTALVTMGLAVHTHTYCITYVCTYCLQLADHAVERLSTRVKCDTWISGYWADDPLPVPTEKKKGGAESTSGRSTVPDRMIHCSSGGLSLYA